MSYFKNLPGFMPGFRKKDDNIWKKQFLINFNVMKNK